MTILDAAFQFGSHPTYSSVGNNTRGSMAQLSLPDQGSYLELCTILSSEIYNNKWPHKGVANRCPAGSNRRLGAAMQLVAVKCSLSTNPSQVHEQRPGMFLMIHITLAFHSVANTTHRIG